MEPLVAGHSGINADSKASSAPIDLLGLAASALTAIPSPHRSEDTSADGLLS
ncbi:MAG: hypothetical protein ABI193_10720 [Minicystis sp.]